MKNNQSLEEIQKILTFQFEDVKNQSELTKQNISLNLNQVDDNYQNILRLLALRGTYGSKFTNAVLYYAGEHLMMQQDNNKNINAILSKIQSFTGNEITVVNRSDTSLIFTLKDSKTAKSLPNINETVCSYEAGMLAGGLKKLLKKDVIVTETKCIGLGNDHCEFEALFVNSMTESSFNDEIIDIISMLANKASSSSELKYKNELFDRQLEFAQNIQKKIIPSPKNFYSNAYKFFAHLQPFRKVGGDFYEYFNIENDKSIIIIADMVGHGIDAAMITSMAKLIFTYCAKDNSVISSPGKIIKQLEEDIEHQLPSTFFSALCLVLDPHKNTLRFVNSGHPDGIILKADGSIEYLKPTLPLIGLHHNMTNIDYSEKEIDFSKGDRLFLFTDGIIEERNQKGEFFSVERFIKIIQRSKHLSIKMAINEVINEFKLFKKHKSQSDDICILGIEYTRNLETNKK